MKKTTFNPSKKIMASASMLLVSAMMLSSATYAWFSINKTVSVTGMQITANSNSTYLLIGSNDDGNDTLAEIQATTNRTTACTIAAADSSAYPSKYKVTGDSISGLDSATAVTNTATAAVAGNWYYRVADLPTASGSTTPATVLTSANFANYVKHKTVYVTLSAGSQAAENLRVSAATIASNGSATGDNTTFTPVKVLVTTATAAVELDSTTTSSNTVLATSVTDQAVIPVDIWIYYDGSDEAVYTNNIANLDGATVNLTFSVDYTSDLNN